MAKPSQLLDSINQQLNLLNQNQVSMMGKQSDMAAKQSITHTMVKQLRFEVTGNSTDIGKLKEGHFKRVGGWQMLVIIGSALLSVSAIIATFFD